MFLAAGCFSEGWLFACCTIVDAHMVDIMLCLGDVVMQAAGHATVAQICGNCGQVRFGDEGLLGTCHLDWQYQCFLW
jgi:hypothetical protein